MSRWGTDRGLAPSEQTAALVNVRLPILLSEAGTCDAITEKLMKNHNTFVPVFTFTSGGVDSVYCRVSAAVYNDESDYEHLAAAMLAVTRDLRLAAKE